jgi:hypothetical protein
VLLHRDTGLRRHRVRATAQEACQANRRLADSGSQLRFVAERLTGHGVEREAPAGIPVTESAGRNERPAND